MLNSRAGLYNPQNIIFDNISHILCENSQNELSIECSGFLRKRFQSGKRPVGIVEIYYNDSFGKSRKKNILLKFHYNAKEAFDLMQDVYKKLEVTGISKNMPRPLFCDMDNNVYFQEYIDGIDLKYYVAKNVILNSLIINRKLTELFNKIGRWLYYYHRTLSSDDTLQIDKFIQEICDKLSKCNYFNDNEKILLYNILKDKSEFLYATNMRLVNTHNDFTLRNIMISSNQKFYIIDWDAMVHEGFPINAPIWNDITTFYLNVYSLMRFTPFIRKKNIRALTDAFIEGYFHNGDINDKKSIKHILWLFTLSLYLGMIGDRPLQEVYRGKLGARYIKSLRRSILSGYV